MERERVREGSGRNVPDHLSDDDGLGSEYGETFERRGRLNDECNRRCNGTNAVETADGSDDGEDDDMGAGSDDAYV